MSLELIEQITLNLEGLNNTPQLTMKSGNNFSNIILVTLEKNSQPIQLEGLKARYCFLRADGTQNLSDALIEEDKIKIILSEKDLETSGTASCELILSENETIVFTSSFNIKVLPNILDEKKVISSDDYSSIITIINKADEVVSDLSLLEQQISENENSRVSNENLRIENENTRQQNELNRQNSFSQITTKANQSIEEIKTQIQNSKEQGDYAKEQGDYAKQQADKISQNDYSDIIDDLKSYIGYTDDDIYGVEVDMKNKKFTRLAGAQNLTEGADFNKINAYNRRRCIINDSGSVVAYYGSSGYVEDGSKGQVMVEQPKFYYKVVPLELEPIANGKGYHLRKARYYICDTPKYGFKLHPAFIQNGVEKEKIYLSAYEGSIFDTSAGAYLLKDEQVADFNTDKLCSIAKAKPCSGTSQKLTRANSRKLSNNRGNGWGISTIQSISATQLLFLIEYASFNTQQKIGAGVTTQVDHYIENQSELTGYSNSLGNASGSVTSPNNYNIVTYRGEENFWGNIFCWVDGINIYNYNKGYVYISDHDFNDDVSEEPYKDIGISISSNGYISSFGYNKDFDWVFIGTETKGDSILPVGDQVYCEKNIESWSVLRFGGYWGYKEFSGAFNFLLNFKSTSTGKFMGARLVYIP